MDTAPLSWLLDALPVFALVLGSLIVSWFFVALVVIALARAARR